MTRSFQTIGLSYGPKSLRLAGRTVAVLAAILLGSACSSESSPSEPSAVSEAAIVSSSTPTADTTAITQPTTEPATPTTEPATTTTEPATTTSETRDVNVESDAEEGLVYDVGQIVAKSSIDGQRIIEFDRFQLDGKSGTDFAEEPVIAGYTDSGWINENSRLRVFPLADDVDLLGINPDWEDGQDGCGDGSRLGEPVVYDSVKLDFFIGTNRFVALTFDASGLVTRVRDISGC